MGQMQAVRGVVSLGVCDTRIRIRRGCPKIDPKSTRAFALGRSTIGVPCGTGLHDESRPQDRRVMSDRAEDYKGGMEIQGEEQSAVVQTYHLN